MGWSAWAMDHIGWVAGGSLAVVIALHFVVVWLFKNSGRPATKTSSKEAKPKQENPSSDA